MLKCCWGGPCRIWKAPLPFLTLPYATLPYHSYPTLTRRYPALPFFALVFSYPACHPPHITSLMPLKVLPIPSLLIAFSTRLANK